MDTLLLSVKSKLSLDDKLYSSITNILLNDNIADKKEHFTYFLSITKSSKQSPQILISALLLYVMDIHKNFKAELLSFLRKNILRLLELFGSFFSIVDISILRNKDICCLKTKVILLNNLYDFYRKVLFKENIEEHTNNCIIKQLIKEYYLFYTKGDLGYLLENINDDVELILSFTFNCFANLVKLKDPKDNDTNNKLEEIKITFDNLMITKKGIYKKLYKNYFSTSSNILFWLFKQECFDDLIKYINKSFEFLNHFIKEHEILLIYIKSMINNLSILNENDNNKLLSLSFDCLKDIIQTDIIKERKDIEYYSKSTTIISFFKLFLETNWYHDYSILINDLFIVFLQLNQTQNIMLTQSINDNKLIPSIFFKLKQEKENNGFIEDNYFIIIEEFIKINQEYSQIISQEINEYLKQIISSKSKTTINECALFSFVIEDSLQIRKEYLDYLLSLPYEKKYIQHISEYSKLFFDYCHRIKKDQQIFLDNYPSPFLKYLSKINLKDLKYLNNLFVNFEKSNSVYLQLIINYIYSINKISYSLIFTLLKPYKAHKKLLYAKDTAICFKNPSLEIEIIFPIEELKEIVKSIDLNLILILIEFLNEFENCNQIFPIIKAILKYNIKSSYAEYKSGIMKSISVYFNFYFNKIIKLCNKSKKTTEEEEYIKKALDNFTYTICYLSDNIYNRPVENLLAYLEFTKLIITNSDKIISQINIKEQIENYITCYYESIFNKGLCCILIGLLNHSWYFVRVNTFDILKHEKYYVIINEMKSTLIQEICKNLFSLRQMDAEGSSYLFLILLYHLKKDFLFNYLTQYLNYIIEDKSQLDGLLNTDLLFKSIKCFNDIISQKTPEYLSILLKPKDNETFDIKTQSIHSYYILIYIILSLEQNTLLIEKKLTKSTIDLLMTVSNQILDLNKELIKHLINNGVSEFSTENIGDNDQYNDNEDKRLISLWCTSKYSLDTLSIIFEMYSSIYYSFSSMDTFEDTILKPITSILYQLISLILSSKHMGVVYSLSDCLYKASLLLIRSNEKYKSYRHIPLEQTKLFIESKLIKEEVSSTLRRSAGIPFLIVSLIRSYISSQFESQTINEILQYSIKSLLNSYSQYQFSNPDVSVHSLHIIRLISDDTYIKPHMKELNDIIILQIIDGLQSENWSIKNACMLMLSRVIKSNFALAANNSRNLPTFVTYFTNNPDFLNKIKEIFIKNTQGIEVNDCLLLFITFFTKFRETKPSEYNDTNVNELLELLIVLGKKNNKLFRKLLTTAIDKMIGGNTNKLRKIIIKHIGDIDFTKEEGNNQLDFYYNIIVLFINRHIEESKVIISKCIEIIKSKLSLNNYFAKTKIIQIIKKYNHKIINKSDIIELPKDSLQLNEIGIDWNTKTIDMTVLFNKLISKNRVFYYYKFIKHSLDFYLQLNYELSNINIISMFNCLKAEEAIVYLFKKYPKKLSSILSLNQLITEIISKTLLLKVSVNISSRIAVYLNSNCKEIPIDTCSQLITALISIAKEEKEKSKLIVRLLPLIGLLIQVYPKELNPEDSQLFCNVILDYSYGHHTEKIRLSDIKCLKKIIECNNQLPIDNTIILKILFLFLNDENPEIRIAACKISLIYNNNNSKALIKAKENIIYTNEYIVKQLLKNKKNSLIDNNNLKKDFVKFISYVFEVNLYFNENKTHLNNDNKVFYFEPDNKYIDNIENKLIIAKNILLSQSIIDHKEISTNELIANNSIPLFVSIELFTIYIKQQLSTLLNENPSLSKNKVKFIFSEIRSITYNTSNNN